MNYGEAFAASQALQYDKVRFVLPKKPLHIAGAFLILLPFQVSALSC